MRLAPRGARIDEDAMEDMRKLAGFNEAGPARGQNWWMVVSGGGDYEALQ